MAVATLPILAGTTLPAPSQQPYRRMYRGGTLVMADGSIVHDLVDTTARYSFRLEWVYLTTAQLATVQSAWAAIKDTTATYTSVLGSNHTVTRPDGGEMEVTLMVTAGGDIKFHVSIELVEDS